MGQLDRVYQQIITWYNNAVFIWVKKRCKLFNKTLKRKLFNKTCAFSWTRFFFDGIFFDIFLCIFLHLSFFFCFSFFFVIRKAFVFFLFTEPPFTISYFIFGLFLVCLHLSIVSFLQSIFWKWFVFFCWIVIFTS